MMRWNGTVTILMAGMTVASSAHAIAAATKGDSMHPRVKIATTLGDIVLELDAEKAPITVMNFIRYAEDKYYDETIFHRVMDDFMIQGGRFTVEMDQKRDGLRPGIKNEWKNGLKNAKGSISMARPPGNPDSATSQFFINVVDNSRLDQPQRDGAAYAVFGKVVEGIDTVEKIRKTELATHPKYGGGRNRVVPVEPVIIKSVTLISPFDRTKVEAVVKDSEQATVSAARDAKNKVANSMKDFAKKMEKETGKTAVTTDSGMIYIDLTEGDGDTPRKTDRVEVHYTGWLLDGSKFDSSVDRGQPFTFSLTGGVIQGWLEGVATMKVGGKRKLIIPPEMAYGSRGRPSIPPNSVLVFDVELLKIAG